MKRKSLTTAILAGLTGMAGMISVSNAVNVNPDGLGQVLLYPYYTARGGNDTLISIVNTTERGKAVKIRFIEAMNSREVLDFNIYMSPYDVWVAAIRENDEGGGQLFVPDNTCTVPYIFGAGGVQDFLPFELDDGGPSGVERTASGYIEVIEMGTMVSPDGFAPAGPGGAVTVGQQRTDDRVIPYFSKHVDGVPRSCDALVNAWTAGLPLPWILGTTTFGFDQEQGASGGLFGSASIVNVADGTMFSYNAVAIDGFWAAGTMSHTRPDSLLPDLSSGTSNRSFVFDNGALRETQWDVDFGGDNSLQAVNATLAYSRLMNEYMIDPDLGARTEWVLTFPTKRFHTDAEGEYTEPEEPIPPFTRTWHLDEDGDLHLPCEDLSFRFWDREETEPTPGLGPPIVSPRPPAGDPTIFQLCKEANVVRIAQTGDALPGATEILGEPARSGEFARLGYSNFSLPYTSGWMMFNLADIPGVSPVSDLGPRTSIEPHTGWAFRGLPVIGFQVTTFTNDDLGGVLANYGGTFNHRGSRTLFVP